MFRQNKKCVCSNLDDYNESGPMIEGKENISI